MTPRTIVIRFDGWTEPRQQLLNPERAKEAKRWNVKIEMERDGPRTSGTGKITFSGEGNVEQAAKNITNYMVHTLGFTEVVRQ